MKFAILFSSFLIFQTTAHADCFQVNHGSSSDPAEVCIATSSTQVGLALTAEIYNESHQLLETIGLSGNSWSGAGARFVTRTGKGKKYLISIEQFSGRDTWATTGVTVSSIDGSSGQTSTGDTHPPVQGGVIGSRCIPGRPSHC